MAIVIVIRTLLVILHHLLVLHTFRINKLLRHVKLLT